VRQNLNNQLFAPEATLGFAGFGGIPELIPTMLIVSALAQDRCAGGVVEDGETLARTARRQMCRS